MHGYDERRMTRYLVLLGLVVFTWGCASDSATTLDNVKFMEATAGVSPETSGTNDVASTTSKPRIIAPGMVISIMVNKDRSLNRQMLVPNGGAIDYPPLGRLVAEGLTPDEVAANIEVALECDYFQTATVHCTIETGASAGGSCVVYVIGNVGRPGPLLLPPNEPFTVTKAIIAAGITSRSSATGRRCS